MNDNDWGDELESAPFELVGCITLWVTLGFVGKNSKSETMKALKISFK